MLKTQPSIGYWENFLAPFLNPAVDGADFNGTTQSESRGANLNSIANSKSGILSAWLRLDGGDGTEMCALMGIDGGNNDGLIFERSAANKINIQNTNGVYVLTSTTSYLAGATWRHILASWDGAVGNASTMLYVNDVSDKATGTAANTASAYTGVTDWFAGKAHPAFGINCFFNGCIAELFWAPGQYLDFSVTANRRKFISALGKPVALGPTGLLPTGVAPAILLHLDDGEAIANFATNRGNGGNFTVNNGPLATASSSPSD